jgi:diaminohydroxyphosphoribosylaminopyrimidine deaminase/5-amino-6-(5-phosphoribosylamino)uracil reductase
MQRCIELAIKGAGNVAPNPMVGAVLVHDGKIIGEGWHQKYGEAHAEVNAIRQAATHLAVNGLAALSGLTDTTLYVSLEPCTHFGKTPPCVDLIIKHKIPKVVIGCRDPFEEVNGKGIEKLKAAGVEVISGIMEDECKALNKRFFTFHTKRRPYMILKWAETADGFIAPLNPPQGGASRLLISNEYSNRLVHKWRSEEAAIMIGTNTALLDNPELTTRLWPGSSPVRIVLDMDLRLPASIKLFNQEVKTIVFNGIKQSEENNTLFYKIEKDKNLSQEICTALYQLKIQSVIIEGGTQLLQSFINENLWDEVRIIRNNEMSIGEGIAAPKLIKAELIKGIKLKSDTISFSLHNKTKTI